MTAVGGREFVARILTGELARSRTGAMSRALLPPALPEFVLRHRRVLLVALHAAVVPVVYAAAFALRFDGTVPPPYVATFWLTLPILVGLRLAVFAVFRQFSGWWRHAGLYDLAELVKAVTTGTLLFWGVMALARLALDAHTPRLPHTVVVLDWGATLLCLGGLRVGLRWTRECEVTGAWPRGGRRALIVGVDVTAERLLRQLRLDRDGGIHPVGLVDDHPAKAGVRLHGVPVLGAVADLGTLVTRHRVALVIIATATTRQEMAHIVAQCAGRGVEFKVLPSLRELLDRTAPSDQPRPVRVEALLGRAPVALDLDVVRADLAGSVVLITGGAGSIGGEMARQVARFGPRRLVLVDQAESPLYFIHRELRERHPELDIEPVIADIVQPRPLERAFARHRPDYVLHAAAYKHVPMMEANVLEAVHNNVLGTFAVAEHAVRYGAKKFVMISTDKAVNPSSVMGATKRAAERLVLEWPDFRRAHTDFRAVRFGNVLGSNGSVVPLFTQQIAAGGPVTVTHRDTTRYFMTIPEAVQLVLEAAALPEATGRIAMLEMGEPVRIVDMAEQLIRLSGLEPYTEVPIVFTGLRPGEKLHEELMTGGCKTSPTSVETIRVLTEPSRGAAPVPALAQLRAALHGGDADTVLWTLHALVPEWSVAGDTGAAADVLDHERRVLLDALSGDRPVGAPTDGRPDVDRELPIVGRREVERGLVATLDGFEPAPTTPRPFLADRVAESSRTAHPPLSA